MSNKQTALQWFEEQSWDLHYQFRKGKISSDQFGSKYQEILTKALAMQKEQIIDARVSGFASSAEGWNGEIPCMKWSEMVRETKCEEYYNETYNKQ